MPTMTTVERKAMKVAERLKQERINNNWSQQELADRAGVDRKTVNRIEQNHFSPSMTTFLLLCDALRVDAQSFFRK